MHYIYERLTVYETPLRFYLVGSNASSSCFNVLKIERSDPKKLLISEDYYQYSQTDIVTEIFRNFSHFLETSYFRMIC